MSLNYSQRQHNVLATASTVQPTLLQQVGMAGAAAVITVTFIHPIDVVKVSLSVTCFSPPVHEAVRIQCNEFDKSFCWL
jgi:hypothetical protein